MNVERGTATRKRLLAKLSNFSDSASRKDFIVRHPRIVRPAIVEQVANAVREEVRVSVKRALALAEAAIVIAVQLHHDESMARALRAKGNVLWIKGQCKTAVRFLERAEALFQRAQNFSEVGRTLSTSIQPLALLGEYERALSAAERAVEIFTRTGEDFRLARLEINVANILHRRGHLTEALTHYEHAYRQLLPYKDSEGIGVALHNMAVCLISLNDFQRAREAYETVRNFCELHGMPLLVAQANYNIAYLHYLRGDYSGALEILQRTRESCRDNGDAYRCALCNLDQSEIYLELNLIKESEELARDASHQFERLSLNYELMKALTNVGIAMSRNGDVSGALKCFAQARHKAITEKNPLWPRIIDLYRALIFLDQGKLSKTQRLAATSLKFFSSYPLPGKAAICHLLLARVGLQAGNLNDARCNCDAALELLRTVDSPMISYQAHLLMGQLQEAEGNLQKAQNSYQTARLALERLRSSLRGEELKISFMKDRQEVYEHLIQLCLRRSSDPMAAEEAFLYMEEAKSRSLRDLLFNRSLSASDSAGEFEPRLHHLRQELDWYYGRIEAEQLSRETFRLEKIQQLQAEARLRENELQRVVREQSLDKVDKRLQISASLKTEKIRAALHEEATIVEYFCARDRLVAAVLTPTSLEVVSLGTLSHVSHLQRSLQFQFSRFRLHGKTAVHFERSFLEATQTYLKQLYDELIAPLRQSLQTTHLIVIPHDILHGLPFHALFDGAHYLIDSFSVSYAPSASIYTLCQTRHANNSASCLIMGIPDPKTPHILQEVQSVATAIPSCELYVGSEATSEVLKKKGPESRIVHIATHGFFRQDNALFSGIRLGDAYLSLYDLYKLQLPVQLMTLSGCSTGLNTVAAGDELLGLVRGLLYAGAQSVLVTLWDVDDSSTAKLMHLFYSLLQQRGKAQALRAAMLEIRKEYSHPYYWAPFVLVGNVFS